jgi:hypothetical protein
MYAIANNSTTSPMMTANTVLKMNQATTIIKMELAGYPSLHFLRASIPFHVGKGLHLR